MQKMIDSHTHIGTYDSWVCPIDVLKYFMDLHDVEYAVTADLSGNAEGARSTHKAIKQAKKFGNTFKILVWINPACKNDLEAAEEIITRYPSWIAGLKIHPGTAGIRLDDDRYGPYMELCRRYNIPFVSHTEKDSFSNTEYLAKWAEAYRRSISSPFIWSSSPTMKKRFNSFRSFLICTEIRLWSLHRTFLIPLRNAALTKSCSVPMRL